MLNHPRLALALLCLLVSVGSAVADEPPAEPDRVVQARAQLAKARELMEGDLTRAGEALVAAGKLLGAQAEDEDDAVSSLRREIAKLDAARQQQLGEIREQLARAQQLISAGDLINALEVLAKLNAQPLGGEERTTRDALIAKARGEKAPVIDRVAVDRAIAKARDALVADQRDDGSWQGQYERTNRAGFNALMICALLVADLDPDHEAITKGIDFVQQQKPIETTYDASVICMMLHALSERRARAAGFLRPAGNRKHFLKAGEHGWMRRLSTRLSRAHTQGAWTYSMVRRRGEKPKGWDHSNTQYAVLGLRAAEHCGLRISTKVWRAVIDHFAEEQLPAPGGKQGVTLTGTGRSDPERGWAYTEDIRTGATPSMTSVGLACIMIAQEALEGRKQLRAARIASSHTALRGGFSWFHGNFPLRGSQLVSLEDITKARAAGRKPTATQRSEIDGYLLFGIERVGALTLRQTFGGHDWYAEGASLYLARQRPDGTWIGKHRKRVETAFGILFLKRGTMRPVVELTTGPSTGDDKAPLDD